MKTTKRIVIDSNIMDAVIKPDRSHNSRLCRDIIHSIRKYCHKVVLSRKLANEWTYYQEDKYFKEWTISMNRISHLKIQRKGFSDYLSDIEYSINQITIEKHKIELTKDAMLFASALTTDKIILSLDDSARKYFHLNSNCFSESVKQIMWVNPEAQKNQILPWLNEGCPERPEWQLKHYTPQTCPPRGQSISETRIWHPRFWPYRSAPPPPYFRYPAGRVRIVRLCAH